MSEGAAYDAGTVFLQVVPSFRGVQERIAKEVGEIDRALNDGLTENAEKTGHDVGRRIGKGLEDEVEKSGTKAGAKYAGKFRSEIAKGIQGAQKELSSLKVDANTDPAMRKLRDVKTRLETLGRTAANVKVDIDAGAAMAELAEIEALLKVMQSNAADINVRVDTASAMSQLAAVRGAIEMLDASVIEPEIKVDRQLGHFERTVKSRIDAALASIAPVEFSADMSEVNREIAEVRADLFALGDKEIGVDIDAREALRQIEHIQQRLISLSSQSPDINVKVDSAAAVGELAAIGALAETIDRLSVDVDVDVDGVALAVAQLAAVGAATKRASSDAQVGANSFRAFSGILLAAVTVGPLLIPILVGIGGALLGLLPVILGVVGGLGVLALGFAGIGAAVGAMGDVEKNAAKDAAAAAKTVATAARGVRDAEQALARARSDAARGAEDATRRVADARRNLRDAERDVALAIAGSLRDEADARVELAQVQADVADGAARALDDQVRAEQDLADAQRDSLKAQEDLIEARREAQRDLEDFEDSRKDLALRERDAILDITVGSNGREGSQQRIDRKTAAGEVITERDLYDRDQDVRDLEEIRQQIIRNADDKARADAGGVEGSNRVKTAQERIADTLAAESEARDNLGDAAAAIDTQRIDGAAEVARSQRDLADATVAVAATQREALASVAAAQRGVGDALRSQSEAAAASAESITLAGQRLADSQLSYQEGLATTSASAQKLDDSMSKLSPAGASFAAFIFGLRDEFSKLRMAAQEGLLPGVQQALSTLTDTYGPSFLKFVGAMSRVLGDLFVQASETFTSPVWREFFATMAKLGPVFMRQFGGILLGLMTAFAGIATAFAPFAKDLGDALLTLTGRFAKWAAGLKDSKTFQDFIGYLERVGPKVAAFLWSLGGALVNVGKGIAPYAEMLLGFFTGILRWIAGMDPNLLGMLVFGILGLIAAFQVAAGIVAIASIGLGIFASTLGTAVFAIVAIVVGLVLLYQQFETVRTVVGFVVDAVIGFFGLLGKAWGLLFTYAAWVWNTYGKATVEAIGRAFLWLWESVLRPTFGFLGEAWGALFRSMKWAWDNVLFPVFQLVGAVFSRIWSTVLKGAFDAMGAAWGALGAAFAWVWENVLRPAWHGLRDAFSAVWENVLKPIFRTFMKYVGEDLVNAFRTGVDAIGSIWSTLLDLAKVPIKFIIDTVINKGLIGGFNQLADFFNTKNIPEIPLPKGFATGGIYPGYTPGRDVGYIGVSGGEAIMRPEWTRAIGAKQVDAMNLAARTGGVEGVKRFLGGFARGGMVRPVNVPYGLAYGNTYSGGRFHSGQDFPANTGTPVLAALPGVVRSVLALVGSYGRHVVLGHGGGLETLYAHMNSTRVSPGQSMRGGDMLGTVGSSGNSTGPHLHFEVRPGGGYGNAADPRRFLSGGADEESILGKIMPDWMNGNPLSFLRDKVGALLDKAGDSPFVNLVTKAPKALLDMALGKVTGFASDFFGGALDFGKGALGKVGDVFSAIGGRGDSGTLYDQGGYLPPGLTTVVNNTGRPEPVFNPSQWATIQRATGSGDDAMAEMLDRVGNQLLERVASATEETARTLGRATPVPVTLSV